MQKILGETSIKYCLDKYEAIENSDALVILTEWKEFANLDLQKVKSMLKNPVIFDGRNLLNREKVESSGLFILLLEKELTELNC